MTPVSMATTSAVSRVLTMLHHWFRLHGYPPSYREIARHAGVTIARVRRLLDQLQALGRLTHEHGVPRSIVMTDRFANAGDDELERACHSRNWTVTKPPIVAIAICEAYPVDFKSETDWEADLLGKLDQKTT